MPQFEVHDSDTGFKLLVEGPEPPSHEEAADLVDQELQFLRTNLYHGANNKFMLDVGPLSDLRRDVDAMHSTSGSMADILAEGDRTQGAIDRAKERAKAIFASRGDIGEAGGAELWQNLYQDELRNAPPIKRSNTPTATEDMGLALSPNTLLLVAHGGSTGGFSTEGGQDFTLHNVAQLLGAKSNLVHNVINTACYGGKCTPQDFQKHFPNVTNVHNADFSMPNLISIGRLGQGDYFATNTTPGIWKRYGTNWVPQLPDYTKLPPPPTGDTSDED